MKKITKTILDPTKIVARTSFYSEHDGPIYFDKDNNRIPYIDIEVHYKPEYDFETRNIKHWWFKYESELFRDIYDSISTFKSRWVIEKHVKALAVIIVDKYVGRFL